MTRKVWPVLIVGLATLCLMPSVVRAQSAATDFTTWTFTQIDFPFADGTDAQGMNLAGQIVGNYTKSGSPPVQSGYLLSNGVFSPIEIGVPSSVRGINIHGDIVGLFGSYFYHGFVLSKGSVTQIDYPGADFGYTIPEDINDVGDVVGYYSLAWGDPEHGFLLRHGVYTTIDYPGADAANVRGINSEGDIVGLYTEDWLNWHFIGFLLKRNGTFTSLGIPGASHTANGINSRGQIVGRGGAGAYLLSQGEYTSISHPEAGGMIHPLKITPDGQHIVGIYEDVGGHMHGFVLSRKPLR